MDKILTQLRRLWIEWGAEIAASLGLCLYLIQAFRFAHTTIPSLDEGAYLYKGLLFAEGIYRPFQPYGLWTNKMPLAFLIPGYVQEIFGAGLRTGRYLAIFEGVLTLVALWLVSRRMSSKWLAAAAVWVIALSPAVIKYYSVAASQSLTACLLAWCLALAIGESRPLWQLSLSSILAGITILTRQNMVILFPLLAAYMLWQHGWKKATWATLAGLGILVFGHWVYWPGILQIWAPWIIQFSADWLSPEFIQSMSEASTSGLGVGGSYPISNLTGRAVSVFQAIRVHFFAITGCVLGILLWQTNKKWKDESSFRAVVFLGVLFILLFLLHSWAALFEDYCVYCLTPYVAFFNVAGILFVILSYPSWSQNIHPFIQALLILILLMSWTGLGFSMFEEIGNFLVELPAPRIRGGQLMGGTTTIFELLSNKFNLGLNQVKKILSASTGFLVGIIMLVIVYIVHWKSIRNKGYNLARTLLISGTLFSPLMAGSLGATDCKMDILQANESAGGELDSAIPPGSTAYWDGGLSVVPLLYAPSLNIPLPQINDGYAYRSYEDSDALLKFGLWNSDLEQKWRTQSDYFIVEEWRYMDWKPFLNPDQFQELPRTKASTSCQELTHLRIFKRIK